MATVQITEANFEENISKTGIVVLDFWAPWCGPCRAFGPVFEKASERHLEMVFGKINTEEQRALASALAIRSIPTLMIFRDGILLFSQPGMLPGAALEELLGKVAALDMDEVRREVARAKATKPQASDSQAVG